MPNFIKARIFVHFSCKTGHKSRPMLKLIKDIFSILDPQEKREFLILQVLVILMAIMEVIGIAGIGPFIALVSDINLIHTNAIYKTIYELSGATSPNRFLLMVGAGSLTLLGFGSLISIITTWRISFFSFRVGANLGDTLYKYYLHREWLFHANSSSANLTNLMTTEANRVTHYVLRPFLEINARLVLIFFISTGIIIYKPLVALTGILIFSGCYFFIYKAMRTSLADCSQKISDAYGERYKLINEGLGGIKDILLKSSQKNFTVGFEDAGKKLSHAQAVSIVTSLVPRYIMEFVAFGSIIALILFLFRDSSGSLTSILPILSIYALAGFKLLPALQQIYANATILKSNVTAFQVILPDIAKSKSFFKAQKAQPVDIKESHQNLIFKNIHFAYPNSSQNALNGITLEIPLNQTIGFVGPSGAGKSTMVELVLGLLTPQSGEVYLDNTKLEHGTRSLQQEMSYVPQSIFVSEGTILENIAFGIPKDQINEDKAKEALRLANLKEFVESLPNGICTHVGERGVKLSGGQRQRLGIARALYNQTKFLIFDEATSSLDGLTEHEIMEEIENLKGNRTIILIAHRLNTVKKCDKIFLFDEGKIIASGNYNDLVHKNERFNQMSRLA